jgi:uncharacterized protein YxjI
MRLYMKQKVFSWRDLFEIRDEADRARWYAHGEIFSWGRKLHVYDADGREVAFIRAKVVSFLSRYFIETGGETHMLVKEFTILRPRFRLEGSKWSIEGDFFAHEYRISDGPETVMSMSKRWLTWGDTYEMDIPRLENELLALCIALTIDCMNADSSYY